MIIAILAYCGFFHILVLFKSVLPEKKRMRKILTYDDTPQNAGEETAEDILIDAVRESIQEEEDQSKIHLTFPEQVFVIPLNRRPFFPGMAAPVMIEPGPFYEVLKLVAKSEHKSMGLFLTKDEDANVYNVSLKN